MRRRKQKNPLLMRIVGVSILVHIVALPVLAHFGAFQKIERHFVEARMVVLPPPQAEKEKPEVKKERKVARKAAPTVKKSASSTPHARQAAQKSNLNQPKVVASAGDGGAGDSGEPTVDANGTGKAGQLPTPQADPRPPGGDAAPAPPPQKEEPPKPEAPKIAQNVAPPKSATPPAPPPEVKKEPVFTEAEPVQSPQPTLPDDLRAETLDKTCVAEFIVGADGTPTNVKITQSTGNDELDRIALETARQWRFKPATRDGQPIESRVRLHIQFQVS
ncbi:MAG TPA: TonB family protein [Chthonomonadaceae bacterium]|nr:TonB family protein [Chthonomonadaceae bacterium]